MTTRKLWLLFAAIALIGVFIAPLALMFVTSMKPEGEVLDPKRILPTRWTTENYRTVLTNGEEAPVMRWLGNSLFISLTTTAWIVFTSVTGAFAFSRLRLPGASVILAVIIGTMMLPVQLFLVPNYLILKQLGWLNTPTALIIPAAAGGFGVFMLSSFMRAIPTSLEEAARIDGCSHFGVLWHVVLPLSGPAIATLGIITFIASWNDFLGPLIYLDSISQFTLPVGISLYASSYYSEFGLTFAASVIATAPLVIVYFFLQREIVDKMAMAGMKD